ncbi:MAG: hypothetical protein ACP5OB_06940 [Candidatus Ratteibacteria bacterium]
MRKRGLALIAVIVMIILFSSLILAVVLSATISIRRANYYKDKLIALEIAEAGIQKILYKMNYEKYGNGSGHYYPFGTNPPGTPISKPNYYPNYPDTLSYTQYDTDIDVSNYGKNASCKISLIDANPTSDTDLDILISEGRYNGKVAKIICRIKGANQAEGDLDGTNYDSFLPSRTKGSCAISESFNKHLIYTDTLGPLTIPASVKMMGNICSDNWPTTINATGNYTYTDALFFPPKLSNDYRPNYPSITIPSDPGTYDDEYDNSGNRTTGAPTGPVNSITDGVWWDGVNYHFGTDDGTNPSSYTRRSNNSVNIIGAGARLRFGVNINNYFKSDQTITIDNTNLTSNAVINANTININTGSIGGPAILYSSNINLNGNTNINGNLILTSGSDINFGGTGQIQFNNGNFIIKDISLNFIGTTTIKNASIISNSNITINNSLTIESNNTTNKYAITLVSSGPLTFTLNNNSQLKITIGQNQISGIIIYSDNNSNSNIYSSISDITKFDTQMALISYSINGTSNINVQNNSTTNDLIINGSIFSFSENSSSTISISGSSSKKTIINGSLISKNVNTNSNSEIIYVSKPFKKAIGDIYVGFSGGRRKYLPVPGSWRILW